MYGENYTLIYWNICILQFSLCWSDCSPGSRWKPSQVSSFFSLFKGIVLGKKLDIKKNSFMFSFLARVAHESLLSIVAIHTWILLSPNGRHLFESSKLCACLLWTCWKWEVISDISPQTNDGNRGPTEFGLANGHIARQAQWGGRGGLFYYFFMILPAFAAPWGGEGRVSTLWISPI